MFASRWSAFGLFIGGLLLAYTCFYSRNGEYPTLSWIMTFVFLACTPIMLMNVFRPAGLKLSPTGVTMMGWRSDIFYPWDSLSNIRVHKVPGRGYFRPKRVWFRIDPAVMGPTESKLGLLTNNHGVMASNFGYSAEQLAEMLLAFQARALARQSDEK